MLCSFRLTLSACQANCGGCLGDALALDGMDVYPRVPGDPALLHTHLGPWLS